MRRTAWAVLAGTALATLACAPAGAAVPLKACKEAADEHGRCGTVQVPLDRADPAAGTIGIAFELYPPRKPAQRLGTIASIPDGPGLATTNGYRNGAFPTFSRLRDRFAILLVDRRGTGKSKALNCRALQRGEGAFAAAIAACGAQLGAASDRYGAADVAEDLEAVRAALGIEKLDLYGAAYGGVEATAYAFRHPDRVRSLVLASPVTPFDLDPWSATQVQGLLRAVREYCARSTPCAREGDDPVALVTALAERLRTAPVEGMASDRAGGRKRVRVDEVVLGRIARFMVGDMINQGELPAAARALLRDDDPAPLLRLGAESVGLPADSDGGPPDEFVAMGALAAATCTDQPVPWDRASPRDARLQQLEAARAALPPERFAPFSVAGWTGAAGDPWYVGLFDLVGSATAYRPHPCIDWPAPDRIDPPIPPGAPTPTVPTLLLAATTSVHTPLEDVKALAARLPGSRYVEVPGMDHMPAIVEPCVQGILNRFYRTFDPGATGNCTDPGGPWYAPGRFPERLADAVEARKRPGAVDRSRANERRAASLMVQTVLDAYYHGRSPQQTIRGLRGGRFTTEYDDEKPLATVTFDGDRLAADIAISGSVTIDFEHGQRVTGELRATGSGLGGRTLRLTVSGRFYPAPDRPFAVRGTVGGRPVRLLVDVY